MYLSLRSFTLALLVSTISFSAQSRNIEKETLRLDELYELMLNTDSSLVFTDCNIIPSDQDEAFLGIFNEVQYVRCSVKFQHCSLYENSNVILTLKNLHFNQDLIIDNCTGYGVELISCTFDRVLKFIDTRCRYATIQSCNIKAPLVFNDCEITECTVEESVFAYTYPVKNLFSLYFQYNNEFKRLIFRDCEFFNQYPYTFYKDNLYHKTEKVYFNNFTAEKFEVKNCKFYNIPVFVNLSINSSLSFEDNYFAQKVLMLGVSFPDNNSIIRYKDLENKICLNYNATDSTYILLDYKRPEDFGELFSDYYKHDPYQSDVNAVLGVYSKLLTIFDNNSDLESYNACYKQMKYIEKTASKVEYDRDQSIEAFFKWKMNEFLDYFCDYGTNPVKSLVFSFYVVSFFCIVYVFFPSEDDNLQFKRLFGAVQRYINHFSEREKFSSTYSAYKLEAVELNRFKRNLIRSKSKLPPVVYFFGKPIFVFTYWLTKIKYRLLSIIEFNIYHDWNKLSRKGRLYTTTIITLSLAGFLIWGLLMRLLNAVALSLNAFVTLGYGEIEASGVARYFCVLEGLVGWFLLSIFSVSLISQILQ